MAKTTIVILLVALAMVAVGFIILYTVVPTKPFPDNVYTAIASFFIISMSLTVVFNLLSRQF